LLIIGLLGTAIWWFYYNNTFIVEPNKRERLVLQSVVTGNSEVEGPGAHPRAPWWNLLERVDLNRENQSFADDEFRTSDGLLLATSGRYDIISGRNFDPVTGRLQHPDTGIILDSDPDNTDLVTDSAVLLAVTRIEFSERKERVADIIKAAIEEELGLYPLEGLLNPARGAGLQLVPLEIEGQVIYGPQAVRTSAHVYQELAKRVTVRTNKRLTFVGINVTGFQFTNLKAKSDATQASIEKQAQNRFEADAADLIQDRAQQRGEHLTYREALSVDDPPSFGVVAQAEATRAMAGSFSDAIRESSREVANGLRHFGRG
jgi:hypothetical protein